MRIAVFGTGGAGGYFGARLAQAGVDVTLIARGEHLQAIRSNGLRLETDNGEITVRSPATDDPARIGAVDVVLLGVKTWQVSEAARAILPMIDKHAFVVPLQNGVDAIEQLAKRLGAEHVVGGLCGTVSWVAGPGRIKSLGGTHFIKFAETNNRLSERTEKLRQAFERAGVRAEIPQDIQAALWEKFMFVVSLGGVGAVTRAPAGLIRALPGTRNMVERCMREILAVGRARAVALADQAVEKSMSIIDGLDPNATSSLQRDIIAGKPSELEAWNGAVVRLGRETHVPTPLNEFIYHSLLPSETLARKEGLVRATPKP